jgi:hypothetical protein
MLWVMPFFLEYVTDQGAGRFTVEGRNVPDAIHGQEKLSRGWTAPGPHYAKRFTSAPLSATDRSWPHAPGRMAGTAA